MHGAGATETSKHFGGGVARFSSDILAIFRLKHPRNSDLGDAPETFSQLWVPRCPELRWSGHFRLRHPRNSDIGDALPHCPETALQLWVPRFPELRWSGHFRLRHPRNSDLGDALLHGGPAAFA